MLILTCIPYHTIPYGIMLSIPPYKPQKHTYGIDLATCIKSCMCSSFRQDPSHDAYVLQCKKHAGNMYLSVTFGKNARFDSFVFLEPWCVIRYLAVEVPKPLPNVPKPPNDAGTEFRKTNRAT